MEFVVIWFICGIIAAAIGSSKGEGFVGFIIGFILGPLGIIAAILSSGNRKDVHITKSSSIEKQQNVQSAKVI